MRIDPVALLAFNGGLQILFSSLFGVFMLVPMQPWGRRLVPKVNMKSLLAAHIDWIMLAFMQFAAAFIMRGWAATTSLTVACLLVAGGWVNPIPYLLRGWGIDAFVFGGPAKQRISAAISGASSAAIITAWGALLVRFWPLLSHP
jgi:hypothetical protein